MNAVNCFVKKTCTLSIKTTDNIYIPIRNKYFFISSFFIELIFKNNLPIKFFNTIIKEIQEEIIKSINPNIQ